MTSDSGNQTPATGRNPDLVYLDSNFYFDYLISNRAGHQLAVDVINAWKAGAVELATSALTLTEVLYVKLDVPNERRKIDRSREPDIIDLFAEYGPRRLRLIETDRRVGEDARRVFYDCAIDPKDAIHVASAIRGRCPVMFSRDHKLLRASGKVGGTPTLVIKKPSWTVQTSLGLDESSPLGR